MSLDSNVGGRDRLVRAMLAVVVTAFAVQKLRGGDRVVGALAAVGALALGFNATTRFCGLNAALGVDTTTDD